MGRLTAGQREIKAIAGALARLPQRVVWKLGAQEIDRAGGLAALSLSPNIKASAWPCIESLQALINYIKKQSESPT